MNIQTLSEKILVNWPVKIICLVLSLLLFLFYRFSTLSERILTVPLSIETNGDLVPSSEYPRTVKIKMRGESESIYSIQESDIQVYFDISSFTSEGDVRVPVNTRLLNNALEIDPLEIIVEPPEIALRIENQIIKYVPIKPVYKGFPYSGTEFGGIEIVPTTVEIQGPRSIVSRTFDISTESIDITAKRESFSGTINLLNPAYPFIVLKQSKTDYRVSLTKIIVSQNIENVSLYFANLDSKFSIEPKQFSGVLVIQGEEDAFASWNQPSDLLTVFCDTIQSEGEYVLPVEAIIPPDFKLIEFSPQQILFTVEVSFQ